jgi:hypothetical protein
MSRCLRLEWSDFTEVVAEEDNVTKDETCEEDVSQTGEEDCCTCSFPTGLVLEYGYVPSAGDGIGEGGGWDVGDFNCWCAEAGG